jgi:hypothetical protein
VLLFVVNYILVFPLGILHGDQVVGK